MNDPALDGGCTCGQVRYRMKSHPMFVHCCHCTWCQRETGTAFALNALIESDRVELLSGQPELTTIASNSTKGQKMARCGQCGVTVWSHYAGATDFICFMRVGTMDHPEECPPDVHIFTSTKQPWVVLPEGAAAVPEFYQRSRYWPAESLARRTALLEKLDQTH